MPHFKAKPLLIEAVKFEGPQHLDPPGVCRREEDDAPYVVTIHDQRVYLIPGDWIVPEPDGVHYYPIKPEILAAKYEPITPPSKTLHNSDISGARVNVPDIKVVGNGDLWQLLCKASSEKEGWMKSTKAMQVIGGCVVQVTTQQRNADGTYAVAEALSFVPNVVIVPDVNNGRCLVGRFPVSEKFAGDWPDNVVIDVTPDVGGAFTLFARHRREEDG